MFNPKVLIITAAVGFVLSFLAGLFSGISFGYILLRALISAIILVLVAIGISYSAEKSLLDLSATSFNSDVFYISKKEYLDIILWNNVISSCVIAYNRGILRDEISRP